MILVTGGTGMTGCFIIAELLKRSESVRIFARPGREVLVQELGAEIAVGDLNDTDSLRRAAEGVTGIIHVATTDPQRPEIDIAAMKALIDGWKQGAMVFISSMDVYGQPDVEQLPVDETLALDEGYSAYSWGKIRCEKLLREGAQNQGHQRFSVLRAPHIWGPDSRYLHKYSLAHFYKRVRGGAPIILPGTSADEWSQFGDAWVDARDIAWACAECLARPLGVAANIVTGHFVWHDVCAELIQLTASNSRIEHRSLMDITAEELPHKQFFAQKWHFSSALIEDRLGFQPTYTWQHTLAEAVEADD